MSGDVSTAEDAGGRGTVRISDYTAGGYFLARRAHRNDAYMSTELLPARFLTLSDCLTSFAFEFWWSLDNVEAAADLGVDRARFDELVDWYTERFDHDFGAPNVAYSTAVIRQFCRDFAVDDADVVIVGCGLSAAHRQHLLEHNRVTGDLGEYGVVEMLDREQPLEPGGSIVGFEPMSYQYGLECSWLCNQLERSAATDIGVRPDPVTGLLATADQAQAVVDYINRDDVGAEPGTWLPWLVVEYGVSAPANDGVRNPST